MELKIAKTKTGFEIRYKVGKTPLKLEVPDLATLRQEVVRIITEQLKDG